MTDGPYLAPTNENPIEVINADMLEAEAQRVIPRGGFGYIRGASGDEWTYHQNTLAFNKRLIIPRVMMDIQRPDTSTSFLGRDLKSPIIVAPMASHGLANIQAEKATAKAARDANSILAVSTYSNDTIEDIAKAGEGAPQWFQLYLSKDNGFNLSLLSDAEAAGAQAIIITVDATVGGNRDADLKNHFTMPLSMANLEKAGQGRGFSMNHIFSNALQQIAPQTIAQIASYTTLPVIVKGIQCGEDAKKAIDAGAAAVYVSNHGGRQLNGAPASIDCLPEVVKAVNGKVPVIFDSGIRRGQHVFKAIASGADIVAIGRPVLYGLALGGSQGVKAVLDYFDRELEMVMQLAGTKTIADIKKTVLKSEYVAS